MKTAVSHDSNDMPFALSESSVLHIHATLMQWVPMHRSAGATVASGTATRA